LPRALPDRTHVWHLYVVRVQDRDKVRERLAAEGIGSGIHYPVPVHLQPAYARGEVATPLPMTNTERAAGEILSLPMHPFLGDAEIERVADALKRAVRTA
jgi:dTDP-4-amino-4,6-dideoxygalactose transaminase